MILRGSLKYHQEDFYHNHDPKTKSFKLVLKVLHCSVSMTMSNTRNNKYHAQVLTEASYLIFITKTLTEKSVPFNLHVSKNIKVDSFYFGM